MRKFGFETFFAPRGRAFEQSVPDAVHEAPAVVLPEAALDHAFGGDHHDEASDETGHSFDLFHDCDHDHDELWIEPAEDDLFAMADGKPSHAGGGGDKGTKGGGRGKDKPVEEPTDGTDGGTTDGGGGSTDGGGGGTTDGGGGGTTTDPGSSQFGWIDESTYVSGAETPDGFNIELVFHGEWTDYQKSIAVSQAELLSENITGDMPGANGIDDLRINFYKENLDGAGGIWGRGGVVEARADGTVLEGRVRLDNADLGTAEDWGMMDELMLHEMLHALGWGTTWNQSGLTSNGYFTGETAMDVFGGAIPLDGSGAHLSNSGATQPEIGSAAFGAGETISDLTLAILEDMGYETIYPDEPEEIAALVV